MANTTPGPAAARLCAGPACSTPLPAAAAPRRRYCSAACRQQAHRARHGRPDPRERAWLTRRAETADAAASLRGAVGTYRDLLQGPFAATRPDGRTGALTAAAIEVRALAEALLAAAVADDRAAGATWDTLAAQLGVDPSTARRRYADPTDSTGRDGGQVLREVPAELPPDTRPTPSVQAYDDLLQRPARTRPAPAPAPAPLVGTGRGWDDGDMCLWRDEGRWGLSGPDGDIEVAEFGLFGHGLAAGDTKGAQAAAAAAVVALTGRAVTGWDRDAYARSVYGPSSWYACLAPPATSPAP